MQKQFEIEIGKQKTVLTGWVEFDGENETDCDGPRVNIYVETVHVESIHRWDDEHTRTDGIENFGSWRKHTVSESRDEWFKMADKIAEKNLDFLALIMG